jgi:hypothetical protein
MVSSPHKTWTLGVRFNSRRLHQFTILRCTITPKTPVKWGFSYKLTPSVHRHVSADTFNITVSKAVSDSNQPRIPSNQVEE